MLADFGSNPAKYCLLWLLCLLCLVSATADATARNSDNSECFPTSSQVAGAPLLDYLFQVPAPEDERYSSSVTSSRPTGPSSTPTPYRPQGVAEEDQWFRFCLINQSDQVHTLVVEVGPATLSQLDFYPSKDGLPWFTTGATKAASTRDIPHAGFGFKVSLAPKESQVFHLRINASDNPFYRRSDIADNPFFIATLWDRDSFDAKNNTKEITFGIVVGIFLALAIYNLLLFVSAQQWTSLFYIGMISSIFIVLLALNGRLAEFAPTSIPRFNNLAIEVFYPVSVFFGALFLRSFARLRNYPKLNSLGYLILGLCGILLVASYHLFLTLFASLCDLVALIVAVYFGVFTPVYAFIKDRLDAAKYVLITLAPMIVCLLDRALFGLGVTEQYYIPYKIVTAAMVAMILFSYFMGLTAYREKQAVLRSANEQLNLSNKLKSNYNKQLEQELEQKTADIRAMNADLEQKASKLLQLDESKSRFFANISHEFRTPLTLIEGPLTMLLEREGFPEKSTLSSMLRNSNALKNLIDQILLLSELDDDSLDLKATQVDISQTVMAYVSQFESAFKQKGVRLTHSKQAEGLSAYVDSEKLQLIVNNLLSNALKFTEALGDVCVEVKTTANPLLSSEEFNSDEYVQIVVRDTGQGIPAHELAHVFDRYFQSDSSELSKSGLGTGIGLALVKELTELHGGSVSVESVLSTESEGGESGTSFTVSLPLGCAHLRDNEIVTEPSSESNSLVPTLEDQSKYPQLHSPAQDDSDRPSVLVVDDNQDMRQHLEQLLSDDYAIVTAADGLQAEEVLKTHTPALIITDLMMPNRDGLEFVQSIKHKARLVNIPIIMLSARAGLQDRIKGLLAEVDDYMVKPFNSQELRARIHNLLKKASQFKAFYHQEEDTPETTVDNQQSSKPDSLLGKAKLIVTQHLMDPDFSVHQLAKALHLSEATLRRRLSDESSFTPAAFIRHCRLEQARYLVSNGQARTVTDLAQSVGFSHPTYFARLYKKTFNQDIDLAD